MAEACSIVVKVHYIKGEISNHDSETSIGLKLHKISIGVS